ncbi:MAG: hypothetical protein NC408_08220 [Candidatus Gastranaerophilales bacterium]|nr:hypothetical protein [Candidatus Gastranaerophilales bacterium]MCM1072637.1 hypothetical protein [Bacteroides sp.]
MRDLLKLLVVGIVICFAPKVFAEDYKVLVVPDNIVTENAAIDSYIYNASAEFFADEVVSILNNTDYIKAPTVSETRNLLKNDSSSMLTAKNMTSRFKTSYNVDYVALKKLANKTNSRYVLLMTSYIDAENYILRRTPWDFLNIPGASVVDPAYKVSTYAVLVDTNNNQKLWSDTYYKTISVCENRIITRGTSPQTEQLSKIKDYSRYVCPQIAENVQKNVLPETVYAKESKQIYYDMGNIDNVFTKKYRHLGKEYDKVYAQRKADYEAFKEDTKVKIEDKKAQIKQSREEKKLKQEQAKLEVKATPVYGSGFNEIKNKVQNGASNVKNAVFKKEPVTDTEVIDSIDFKRNKKNTLFGDYDNSRPELRDYNH